MSSPVDPAGSPLHLGQQKKRAKELLVALRDARPEAIERLRAHHPRVAGRDDASLRAGPWALHDAQLVLARENGFASWPAFRAHIDQATAARRTRLFIRERPYYDDRAEGLVSAWQDGVPAAFAQIREWHPRLVGATDEEIRAADFTLDDARIVHARQHGAADWAGLMAQVDALAQGDEKEPFLRAFEAMPRADVATLRTLVDAHPDLLRARGTNGNSLLNLAVSLGCHLPSPLPAVAEEMLDILTRPGADVDLANDRGWTPLHQAAYSNHLALAERLLAAGASISREAHGAGGTPLAVALFWGHREVADLLAARGIVPANLRIAAALGRVELVDAMFDADGTLRPEAGQGRAFHRPHSGFPVWHPRNDRQEILDEALVWAAKSGRVEVLGPLVARGANLAADPYRGTALLWAASRGRVDAIRWLLDHGADIDQRATFGGHGHGEGVTALHLAAQRGEIETVRLLVDRGADPTIRDLLYDGMPDGWAEHDGHPTIAAFLRTLPGVG